MHNSKTPTNKSWIPSSSRLATFSELTTLLIRNGRWWLVPMVGILGLASVLLVAIQIIEYVAPFVYTIF